MRECTFLVDCPISQVLKKDIDKKTMFKNICIGEFVQCYRWKLRSSKQDVPITLMPDGTYMK